MDDIDDIALCDSLRNALMVANSLNGHHARESDGGSYGAIKTALIRTLANVLMEHGGCSNRTALKVAREVYDESVRNGESIHYCLRVLGILSDGVLRGG